MAALAAIWPCPRISRPTHNALAGRSPRPGLAPRRGSLRLERGPSLCLRADVAEEAQTEPEAPPPITRLNRAIASSGLCSRRAADRLIKQGVVTVNDTIVEDLATFVGLNDKVCINGKQIWRSQIKLYYFAVNKPKGYICSAKPLYEDERTAISLMNDWLEQWKARNPEKPVPRLFTVGRLDVQSVGLIFITNDGEWASRMIHPSYGLTKEYNVTLTRRPLPSEMRRLAQSVEVEPGVRVTPVSVSLDESRPGESARVRIVLSEGRTHEIRKLVATAGLNLKTLRRTRIGDYRLPKEVPFGSFVRLTRPEAWNLVKRKKVPDQAPVIVSRGGQESDDDDEM